MRSHILTIKLWILTSSTIDFSHFFVMFNISISHKKWLVSRSELTTTQLTIIIFTLMKSITFIICIYWCVHFAGQFAVMSTVWRISWLKRIVALSSTIFSQFILHGCIFFRMKLHDRLALRCKGIDTMSPTFKKDAIWFVHFTYFSI